MNTSNQPKNFIKTLQIVHFLLLFSVVVFGAYVAIAAKDQLFFSYKEDKAFLYLAILISFIGNLASKFLFAKMLQQIPTKANLDEKIVKYSSAHIFRIAMLEFPAFMCIIFTMQSNNSFYFMLSGILVFMMLALFPTKDKFANEVELTDKEKSILEKL
jgi:hypothetical protein